MISESGITEDFGVIQNFISVLRIEVGTAQIPQKDFGWKNARVMEKARAD